MVKESLISPLTGYLKTQEKKAARSKAAPPPPAAPSAPQPPAPQPAAPAEPVVEPARVGAFEDPYHLPASFFSPQVPRGWREAPFVTCLTPYPKANEASRLI